MVAEATTKPAHHSGEEKQHKQLDREVRDMVSAITSRVSHLHKDGSSHGHHEGDDDGHGVRIITLAGTNTGATMKGELGDEKAPKHHLLRGGEDHHDALRTYVNSNFQAINNSIMMGGSYTTNDPGVHMDIADLVDDHGHGHKDGKKKKTKNKDEKKEKNKDKESSKSDHHSGSSD